jgi:hypothetical protein
LRITQLEALLTKAEAGVVTKKQPRNVTELSTKNSVTVTRKRGPKPGNPVTAAERMRKYRAKNKPKPD